MVFFSICDFNGILCLTFGIIVLNNYAAVYLEAKVLFGNNTIDRIVEKSIEKLLCPKAEKKGLKRPPQQSDGVPLLILAELHVNNVADLRLLQMDYRMDFLLRQFWTFGGKKCMHQQERLMKAKNYSIDLTAQPIHVYSNEMSSFWLPDTFIPNARQAKQNSPIADTKSLRFQVKVAKEDNTSKCLMEYEELMSAIVACPMRFNDYPLDIQRCPIQFQSLAFPRRMVNYKWKPGGNAVKVSENINLLEHTLTFKVRVEKKPRFNETYRCLFAYMYFERSIVSSLIGIYIPSTIILVFAISPCFMKPQDISDRITISMTCILALITQFASVLTQIPTVSYVTVTDIWMMFSLLYVALATFESLVVNVVLQNNQPTDLKMSKAFERHQFWALFGIKLSRKPKKKVRRSNQEGLKILGCFRNIFQRIKDKLLALIKKSKFIRRQLSQWNSDNHAIKAEMIDEVSRIAFPLLLVAFNAVYWPILFNRMLKADD